MAASMSRRVVIAGGLALAGAGRASAFRWRPGTGATALPLVGVNLAGAEFGQVPGRHTIDYMYPSAQLVAYFADLGFNCLRVPVLWERLQPDLYGEFSHEEQELLVRLIGEITSRRLVAVIDPHNYAKRRLREDNWSSERIIGSASVPTNAFVDFWRRLSRLFKADERVVFGLMNEPVHVSATDWLEISNRTIANIRDEGATNLITVPGTAYTGAHSWLASGNAVMSGIVDSLDHFAIEVHQYFDRDSSGTTPTTVSSTCGSDRLRDFQDWARQHKLKAFLGEFGATAAPISLGALSDICDEMRANDDVWLGWTAWAAGPFWPQDYMFNLGPAADGSVREQTRVLAAHARPGSGGGWERPGAAIDIDLARERVHGCRNAEECLSFSTPRVPQSGQRGPMLARGQLLALLDRAAFTLVIETKDLHAPDGRCDILNSGNLLLVRTADGALRAQGLAFLQTKPQPRPDWRLKRRCALSVSRNEPRLAIAVTGGGAISGPLVMPAQFRNLALGAGPVGSIDRISVIPGYFDESQLEELVA